MDKKKIKAPSFIQALVILLVVVAILMLSVTLLDVSIQIALLFSIIIASCFAIFLGYKWDDVQKMMMDGVMSMLIATFILMLIGAVIATWIASGTIPYIIYLGLKLISPKFFFTLCMPGSSIYVHGVRQFLVICRYSGYRIYGYRCRPGNQSGHDSRRYRIRCIFWRQTVPILRYDELSISYGGHDIV